MKILCVHQSAELYGSDRSFAQSIVVLRQTYPTAIIDVILPNDGPLISLLEPHVNSIRYENLGSFARKEIRRPIKFLSKLAKTSYRAMINTYKYDFVYVNTMVIFGYLIGSIFGRKIINHVREIPSSKLEGYVFSIIFALNRSLLVFNSYYTKNSFPFLLNKTNVIHNGVKAPVSNPIVEHDVLRLLVIGRINGWKGQSTAVDAVKYLIDKGHNLHLDIVGDTAKGQQFYKLELQKRISKLALSDFVKIHSFSSDPQAFYNHCDVVLVPSIHPEPFGRVAIEGMASARAVVASNHGGLTEIIGNNQGGDLFIPGDSLDLASKVEKYFDFSYLSSQSLVALGRFEAKFSQEIYEQKLGAYFKGTVGYYVKS
ncbi:glycosyltransferase family 4 protein [Photobacterium indicum]|uniref:glycosyltransferase family 4 protein n=1 Tax=Photobacterium indicum TaxID=81447 RepID=UPI003D13A834